MNNIYIFIVCGIFFLNFSSFSIQDDSFDSSNKNIHVVITKKKNGVNHLFAVTRGVLNKSLEQNDCIVFDYGFDRTVTINRYLNEGENYIIWGDNYLEFTPKFITNYLHTLPQFWEDSIVRIINTSIYETNVRNSFRILENMILINKDYSVDDQCFIDSLSYTSFRIDQSSLIHKTNYFLNGFKQDDRICRFFSSKNRKLAIELLENIEIKTRYISDKDSSEILKKKHLLNSIKNYDNVFMINPSMEKLSYLKDENVTIYLNHDLGFRKKKKIKEVKEMVKKHNFKLINVRFD